MLRKVGNDKRYKMPKKNFTYFGRVHLRTPPVVEVVLQVAVADPELQLLQKLAGKVR